MLHKLKLTNYNAMIKIDKQDLIGIIDIKNARLSDKNGIKNMSYSSSTKVLQENVVQKIYIFYITVPDST